MGSEKTVLLPFEPASGDWPIVGDPVVARSRGVRDGAVVDPEAYAQVLRELAACLPARITSGGRLHVHPGVSGLSVQAATREVTIGLPGRQIIDGTTLKKVGKAIRRKLKTGDRVLLHFLPRRYVLDDGRVFERCPWGLRTRSLAVRGLAVTSSRNYRRDLERAVGGAGMVMMRPVYGPVASAWAVTSPALRQIGSVVLDIGGSLAKVATTAGGFVTFADAVNLAGAEIVGDVAAFLGCEIDEARRLLETEVGAEPERFKPEDAISYREGDSGGEERAPARQVSQAIRLRLNELMTVIRDSVLPPGALRDTAGPVLITGGVARLGDVTNPAREVFERPARIGVPEPLPGLDDSLRLPEYAGVLGIAMHVHQVRQGRTTN